VVGFAVVAKGHGETVNVTADDARQSIAAGLGNSIAKGLTLGANWVIAAFGDGSAPLLETGHPFEPKSDLFGRQAEAIGDGLQAVAGAKALGNMGAGIVGPVETLDGARQIAAAQMYAARKAPELKKIFGWGNGLEGVENARKALDATAMERIQGSMTRREVEVARDVYKNATGSRGGAVAPARAEYMEEILKRWKN
jgi:hypothetical protein